MAAGRTYYKKGSTPPAQTGYTGLFAGADGLVRAIQSDGTVTVIQSSGTTASSGLAAGGIYLFVSGGEGITVTDTVAFNTVFGDGRYEASGTVSTHEVTYDHGAFVASTRALTAGSGLTGGGTLASDRRFDIGAGSGISVSDDHVHVDYTAVQASGNYPTVAEGDIRYALSGSGGGGGQTTNAGSGLTRNGDDVHVGAGSGLYLQADLIGVDFTAVQASGNYPTVAEGDIRYALSGSGGGGGQTTNAGSGLTRNGDDVHAQIGSGLYLQDDLIGLDLTGIQRINTLEYKASGHAQDILGDAIPGSWTMSNGTAGTVDLLTSPSDGVYIFDSGSRAGALLCQGDNSGSAAQLYFRLDYTLADGESVILAISPSYNHDDTSSPTSMGSNEISCSLYLNNNDASATTGDWIRIHTEFDPGSYYLRCDAQNSTGGAEGRANSDLPFSHMGHKIYFRFARDGTRYHPFFSRDCRTWCALGNGFTFTGAHNNVWIAFFTGADQGDPAPIHSVDWVRFGTNDPDPW